MSLSAIIFILFAICIFIMNYKSRYIRWIVIISLVLSLTIIFLQIYFYNYTMIIRNVLQSEKSIFFSLDAALYNILPRTTFGARDIERVVNYLSAVFMYLSLVFPVVYGKKSTKIHEILIIVLLFIPMLLIAIFYDPMTNYYLHEWVLNGAEHGNIKLRLGLIKAIHTCLSLIINGYYFTSVFLWYKKYKMYKLKIVRNQILFISTYLLTMSSLFMLLFIWLPIKNIEIYNFYVKLSFIPTDYTISYSFFTFLPLIVVFIFVINFFGVARQQIIKTTNNKQKVLLKNDLAKANQNFQGVFHAFKNEFIGINFLAQKLMSDSITKKETVQIVGEIEQISSKYIERINNLRDHLKNQSIILKRETVVKLIQPIVDTMNMRYENIKFDILDSKEDETIYVDKLSFTEVVENIMVNAAQAIESKEIDYGFVQIEVEREGEWLVIHITDNGEGIAKEDLKKVFMPFFSKKNYNKNWGIGLSYCRSIIDSHGGDIEIQSVLGEYTVVNLILPLR